MERVTHKNMVSARLTRAIWPVPVKRQTEAEMGGGVCWGEIMRKRKRGGEGGKGGEERGMLEFRFLKALLNGN